MKKKIIVLFLSVLFIGFSFGNIYSINLPDKWIPANAKWIINVDLSALVKTEIWNEIYKKKSAKFDRKLDKIFRELKVDLLRDIDSITLFGNRDVEKDAVILVSGNFNKDYIINRLRKEREFEEVKTGKYTIYKWDGDASGAFLTKNLVLFGHNESVLKEILKRKSGGFSSSSLFGYVKNFPKNTLIFAIFNDPSSLNRRNKSPFIVQNAKMLIIKALNLKGDLALSLSLQTENSERAKNLVQIANGLIALVKMNKEKKGSVEAMRFLERLSVSASGNTLNADLLIPAAEISKLSEK